MTKFKVGDKVRVRDGVWSDMVGTVVPTKKPWFDYDTVVDFGGENNDWGFGNDELELVEPAPFEETLLASGAVVASYETFEGAVLVGGTSINDKLRQYAKQGVEVEVVVRVKGAK